MVSAFVDTIFCYIKRGQLLKPFKNLDQQIAILKRRGLNINDISYAKRYLLTNNYYDVINGYSKFFTVRNNNERYISLAEFEEIKAVHLFDKEFKSALLKALIEAEKHFKSVVAYRFSEKFPEPYAYLKTENFRKTKNFNEMSRISKLIGNLTTIINSNIKKNHSNSIKHYYYSHGGVPFWVLCNDMTFGQIVTFYENLDDKLKEKIAFDLSSFLQDNILNITGASSNNIISVPTLSNFLKNANEFRNIAAHNNLLFRHRCWKNLKFQRWMPRNSNHCNKQGLYYVFLYLQCLLSASQYATLHNTFLKRVTTLKKKLKSISISKILLALDFPSDWDTCGKIPQSNSPKRIWKINIDSVKSVSRAKASRNRFKIKSH
ncbi:Abortive infection bacteriophage resistance protein [Streptococcus equi subsp. zooepidemicus]|uniref:Abortive infection bacteriophage resistance protein n=2 Tax=Streptococcus equi TaxID=1336 RepID=A0AAX2LIQ1_STRSZ|nr:Abi family protein [Streptococcus equi]SQE95759.1 Abortive infection bacteriophage resistance protein [Streptococcus equi subsp. zooepidemicus]SQF05426.1 Abortive infection bacteriophage resistance protein [Streptococcus equi subsp. zooepidemicus]SUO82484.1 Abortive infection bacteriophage resistance protein [Streptococcus equi subsp. zooepidemicus]